MNEWELLNPGRAKKNLRNSLKSKHERRLFCNVMLLSLKNFGLRLGGLQHPRVLARTKNDCGQDSIPSFVEVFALRERD